MSNGDAERGHTDEGFRVDRPAVSEHGTVKREIVRDAVTSQTA